MPEWPKFRRCNIHVGRYKQVDYEVSVLANYGCPQPGTRWLYFEVYLNGNKILEKRATISPPFADKLIWFVLSGNCGLIHPGANTITANIKDDLGNRCRAETTFNHRPRGVER